MPKWGELSLTADRVSGGALFLLDVLSGNVSRIPMTGYDGIFHPHGVGVHRENGKTRIFVVSHRHRTQADQVLLFDFEEGSL